MTIECTVEHKDSYAVARIGGEPDLDEMLNLIQSLGEQSKAWPNRRVLFDLRGVRTLRAFTEHYAMGEAVARHLGHLARMASVVPADRITRASEKTAQQRGANLLVFTDEGEALRWLQG